MTDNFTVLDHADLALGALPLPYVVGASVNAAQVGAWASIGSVAGASIPMPARRVIFWADQTFYIYLYGLQNTLAQAGGSVGAGAPAVMACAANHVYDIEIDCWMILYLQWAGGGTLHFTALA